MDAQESVWKWLIQAEWQGSLLILLLLVISLVFGLRFPARWRFAVWLVVMLRFLVPALPVNPAGIFHYVPATPVQAWDKITVRTASVHLDQMSQQRPASPSLLGEAHPVPVGYNSELEHSPVKLDFSWEELKNALFWLWAAVAVAGGIRLLISHLWFYRKLRRSSRMASHELHALLREGAKTLGIEKSLPLLITDVVRTPAVVGLWTPRLLLPEDAERKHSQQQLKLILLHELVHVRRRDQWTNLVTLLAGIVHWFNPLIWLAMRQMHIDREMAVDAVVLAKQGRDAREEYGETLLSLLNSEPQARTDAVPMLGILERKSELKKRLIGIVRFQKSSYAWSIAGVALLLLTVAIGFGEKLDSILKPLPATMDGRREALNRFFLSIRKGDLASVDEYVKRGVDVNSAQSGNDALFEAVTYQRTAIVRLFLSKGVRVNEKTDWGETSVMRALLCGNHEIADLLVAAGAQYDKVLYLVSTGKLNELKAIDKRTPLEKPKILDALRYAANAAQSDVFDWLLAKVKFANKEERARKLCGVYLDDVRWGAPSFLGHLEALGANPVDFGGEALEQAIWHDGFSTRVEVVRHLLEKGVPATAKRTSASESALRQIVYESRYESKDDGSLKIAGLLLDHGADVNALSNNRMSLVSEALFGGRGSAMVKLLLNHGADPKIEDKQGRNAAWSAACNNVPEILSEFIKQGVNVKGRDKGGMTILHAITDFSPLSTDENYPCYVSASEYKAQHIRERQTVKILVKAGVELDADWDGYTPFMYAIRQAHYPAAEELMEKGASVSGTDKYGNTALALCVGGECLQPLPIQLISSLLKKGANPNAGVVVTTWSLGGPLPKPEPLLKQAFCEAAVGDSARKQAAHQAIILLLEHGATFTRPVNAKTAILLEAAAAGDLEGIKQAVAQHADVNGADGDHWTPLTVALAIGNTAEADWLIQHGASCNAVTSEGYSPLYFAVCCQNESLVKRALADGADPKIKTNMGGILIQAIQRGNMQIFDALLQKGVKGSTVDLVSCIRDGQTGMARKLLEAGTKPEDQKPFGNRRNVFWAVDYDQAEILKLLLDYGADPNVKEDDGSTPLKLARDYSFKDLIPILKAAIKQRGETQKKTGVAPQMGSTPPER